jgi:putative addiction module component (TIGR02574 family)
MTEDARKLFERALKLPEDEREDLAFKLLGTVSEPAELSPSWRAEIERRVEAVLSGKSAPGDDYRVVMKRLKKRLDSRRRKSR